MVNQPRCRVLGKNTATSTVADASTGGKSPEDRRLYRLGRLPADRREEVGLKIIQEWDTLAKQSDELVAIFAMESISRKTHPTEEWDFHLGSELCSCLQNWKGSYHMLAALDSPEGKVYDAVKHVALRLEKIRAIHFERNELRDRFKFLKKKPEMPVPAADSAVTSGREDKSKANASTVEVVVITPLMSSSKAFK
ncbi:hypothetical protein OESDEN_01460 [Oesophagostomum dentatum]|uniref:Uncharacterized protein n=1 Tax=Oesophagostomum dentatum TaxID=61180 RepID=A0A0B1TRU2_OESDE|nr:hypothetical protein OESDEN_01460 [Oesophagostomum dentatum]